MVNTTAESTWGRKVGIYFVHVIIANAGVWAAALLLGVISEKIVGSGVTDQILARPIFPLHIVLGFLAGFLVNGRLQSKSALWAWIPTVALLSTYFLPSERIGGLGSTATYLFGKNCSDCLEQFLVVSPFYASVAYSIGAWLALKSPPIR